MEKIEREIEPVDVSEAFRTMSWFDFSDRLRQLRKEPVLKIFVDLSQMEDRQDFVEIARRLKAFLEIKPQGQKRFATIRAKKIQVAWEPNVFSSGVVWDQAD
mgnify:CR=1 FL=1